LQVGTAVLIVAGFVVVDREQLEIVVTEVERFTESEIASLVLIEGMAREADEHDHNAHVDEVAAVAASVAPGEFKNSFGEGQLFFGLDGAGAFPELDQDGAKDKGAQAERDESAEVTDTGNKESDAGEDADEGGYLEGLLEAAHRTLAPGD